MKLFSLSLLGLAAAAPLEKRQMSLSMDDIAVLQLAHYLENLEYNLYTGGFNNFTEEQYQAAGFPAGFRDQIGVTADQENTHRMALAQVLQQGGQTPLPECTYSFPYSDPVGFVDLANMVTTVGIGAYLGGATMLMDSAQLLTTAASILSVEARHDSLLRSGLGGAPFPTPYDTSLTALWAYNLAHMFVVSCPMELPGVVLLPQLKQVSPMPEMHLQPAVPAGTTLTFQWDPSQFFVSVAPGTQLYIAMINQVMEPVFQPVTMTGDGMGTVPVPEGVAGVAFAVLTTFSGGLNTTQLTQFGTLAGPAEVVLA